MSPEAFREAGHRLIDRMADFLASLPERPVAPGRSPAEVRAALGSGTLPARGTEAGPLLDETADLLLEHSTFSGHPRFWGYILGSASPMGTLADILATTINPNLGGWMLSPIATEIEVQTVRWIAEFLGYPTPCGGLLCSGGNMANFIGFWAGRRAMLGERFRREGMPRDREPRVYASRETHTWIQKAVDLSGMGTNTIRWIPGDDDMRMKAEALREQIERDTAAGDLPLVVVATAGTVSTGAVDPLPALAGICREFGLWLHVDGAYGGPAAALPGASADLKGLALADSVAVDPHKWLYNAVEAGCILVRDPEVLRNTFSYTPSYYPERNIGEDPPVMFYEYGPQNSRSFRALKVWLGLRQAGREGYARMIAQDIALARLAYELAGADPELEAGTHGLSIATFRYVPRDLEPGSPAVEDYLNRLNRELVDRIQKSGEAFLSNAVIGERFLLRMCIVNFRTTEDDVRALPGIVTRLGREADAALRPPGRSRRREPRRGGRSAPAG
jgi:glutamate/tyrosine decarboxylase-like PLP-dependent enzyme